MVIVHGPECADYGSAMRPEQPARIRGSVAHLRSSHPDWLWHTPAAVADDVLLLAHTPQHLKRLVKPFDFDNDTPFFPDILEHARRAVGAALTASDLALGGGHDLAFSLMRPPGHHATAGSAMGFCYLNQIAIAALRASAMPNVRRVGIWDFDAHHGNGTEAIVRGRKNIRFSSVHQYPGYPGTGTASSGNIFNWPVAPHTPRSEHMTALRRSLDTLIAFDPELILVSAGFDAYARDPITAMTLEIEDFSTLGHWLRETGRPAAAVLEGGYSGDLPLLIDAFLSAWEK